jgi:hypothetical protein
MSLQIRIYRVGSKKDNWIGSYAISNNNTQNRRPIRPLGSATGKGFNTYSVSSLTTGPKRESFLQIGFQGRGCPYLGCASQATQNRSPVYWRLILSLLLFILGLCSHMGSLLETVYVAKTIAVCIYLSDSTHFMYSKMPMYS